MIRHESYTDYEARMRRLIRGGKAGSSVRPRFRHVTRPVVLKVRTAHIPALCNMQERKM